MLLQTVKVKKCFSTWRRKISRAIMIESESEVERGTGSESEEETGRKISESKVERGTGSESEEETGRKVQPVSSQPASCRETPSPLLSFPNAYLRSGSLSRDTITSALLPACSLHISFTSGISRTSGSFSKDNSPLILITNAG